MALSKEDLKKVSGIVSKIVSTEIKPLKKDITSVKKSIEKIETRLEKIETRLERIEKWIPVQNSDLVPPLKKVSSNRDFTPTTIAAKSK